MGTRVIRVAARDVPRGVQEMSRDMLQAIARGTNQGAQRARTYLVRRTPVDQGQLKASWEIERGTERRPRARWLRSKDVKLAELKNRAPHAGIVELGARPHPVSEEGIQAIARWAMRVLTFKTPPALKRRKNEQGPRQRARDRRFAAALGIARAIAWRIRHKGQKPTYYVRDSVPTAVRLMAAEVHREMAKVSPKVPRKPRGPKGGP